MSLKRNTSGHLRLDNIIVPFLWLFFHHKISSCSDQWIWKPFAFQINNKRCIALNKLSFSWKYNKDMIVKRGTSFLPSQVLLVWLQQWESCGMKWNWTEENRKNKMVMKVCSAIEFFPGKDSTLTDLSLIKITCIWHDSAFHAFGSECFVLRKKALSSRSTM